MSKKQWRPYLIALAFTCFGFAMGISVDRLYLYQQAQKHQQVVAGIQEGIPTLDNVLWLFSKQLKLSKKQIKTFKKILQKQLRKGFLHIKNRPPEVQRFIQRAQQIREEFRKTVREILSPKQKHIFNEMVEKIDKRRMFNQLRRYQFQKQATQKTKNKTKTQNKK